MRIDKFLSDMAVASRKESSRAAKRGGILVNGAPVRDASVHIDPERDTVCYLGRVVEYRKHVFVMLNKPEGYVSATDDKSHPYVTELLPPELRARELFPVGRLDKDTVGLMLLTDDGESAHRLLTPKRHVTKSYRFKCAEPLISSCEDIFLAGAVLGDGYVCKSATLVADADRLGGIITLTEGKYHQIKRMLGSVGNKITALERITFGPLSLDTALLRGEWRYLTERETAELLLAAGADKNI